MSEAINLQIVFILAIGFAFASLLGYASQRAKLSPLVGYLLAGYLIGPYSPGYTADMQLAEQLAEIGVILMMFGVGLHFKWQDLLNTSHIAIPGAILQTLFTAGVSIAFIYTTGWSLEEGIVLGLALGVASTVVLVRVLSDNSLLNTPQGHIAVGWLIVEDMITVAVLLLIPTLAMPEENGALPLYAMTMEFCFALAKFLLLVLVMFTFGKKIISNILARVLETNSHELFTLTILAITFGIAASATLLLGISIALGAFIAGMLMGQTAMRQQVAINAMSLKDTFVVIFFLAIGMLFNPEAIFEHFFFFIVILAIVIVVKPLVAFIITLLFKYPLKTALTVALALAQIGEFSFILAEEAFKFDIFPDEGYDIIVACALISIAINPLLFKFCRKRQLL